MASASLHNGEAGPHPAKMPPSEASGFIGLRTIAAGQTFVAQFSQYEKSDNAAAKCLARNGPIRTIQRLGAWGWRDRLGTLRDRQAPCCERSCPAAVGNVHGC